MFENPVDWFYCLFTVSSVLQPVTSTRINALKILLNWNLGVGRHGARLQDHLQRRLEERKQRQRGKLGFKQNILKLKGVNSRAGPSLSGPINKPPIPFRTPVVPITPALIGKYSLAIEPAQSGYWDNTQISLLKFCVLIFGLAAIFSLAAFGIQCN